MQRRSGTAVTIYPNIPVEDVGQSPSISQPIPNPQLFMAGTGGLLPFTTLSLLGFKSSPTHFFHAPRHGHTHKRKCLDVETRGRATQEVWALVRFRKSTPLPAHLAGAHLPTRRRRCVRSEAFSPRSSANSSISRSLYSHKNETREFVCRNSFELSSRKWSRNRGWLLVEVKDGTDCCHGGGNCGELGLPKAGEHANEGGARNDVVFRCSYGGASGTGVGVSCEVNSRGSTSDEFRHATRTTTDGTLF
jgi:hypothetical protein